ncbi:hypothetical protein L1049_021757 [Liquidambar formosana]|uniref:Uncharacterized protein n=1 Tax=Liquidambar formosana TaxID=63359 RepID=A0AAP0WPI1_LIQFO
MAISMDLPVAVSFCRVSRASLCPCSLNCVFFGCALGHRKLYRRWKCISKPIRLSLSSEKDSFSPVDCGEFWGDSETVEVIGIGSRKDAILDFCLRSPFQSASLRFWNILMKDSMKVQLQQRFCGKDITPRIVEAPLSLHSCSKAIILVASAGYGLDHVTAIDIIKTVRSLNGFAIAIVLKPFSFEGQRRQDEVRDLVEKLQEHTNLCIDIDTDALLKLDLVTLDEALKTANNAVLLAINAISVLISETHRKLIDVPHINMKELKFPELMKILESYKEAKIGFGAGHNIQTSIARAIYDCPFLSAGIKLYWTTGFSEKQHIV